ncbi:MAG: hypothetical protein GY759_04090 [Chloroflexi bacterium]|nr:hypothetical protein [Chloroflexota bacterium]
MLLAAIVLSLVVFVRQKRIRVILQYLAGAVLAILPLIMFNTIIYGNPLGPQIASNYSHLSTSDAAMYWVNTRHGIIGSFFPITSKRWLTVYVLIVGAVVISRIMPATNRPVYAVAGLEISALIAVAITVTYLRNRWGIPNFVEASPWMVLVPWVLVHPSTDRWPNRVCVAGMLFLCAAFTVLVVLLSPITGGSQWGGRFFLLVTPIWVILGVMAYGQLAAYVREHSPGSVHRFLLPIAFYAIVISSVVTTAAGIENLSSTKRSWEPLGQLISELPRDTVLATNSWWIPLVLAPDFYDHYFFRTGSDNDLCQLSFALLQEGISSISMISTPKLLNTPTGSCVIESVSLKEVSISTVPLWTPVVIQNYTILPAGSQN